jgi:streptogramin lyase
LGRSRSVTVAKDGAVWVTAFNDPTECVSDRGAVHNCSRGQLWRLDPKTGAAKEVPLPFVKENNVQPMIPYLVRAYEAGIWVAAKTLSSQRHALLFTRNL